MTREELEVELAALKEENKELKQQLFRFQTGREIESDYLTEFDYRMLVVLNEKLELNRRLERKTLELNKALEDVTYWRSKNK